MEPSAPTNTQTISNTQPADELELLTASEAGRMLKANPSTVYRLLQTGAIPSIRFGRLVRITRKDLSDFILSHRTV
jgi:excisionase family DNA binding protein